MFRRFKRTIAGVFLASVAVVLLLRWVNPPTSSFIVQRQVRNLFGGKGCSIHHEWVPLRSIAPGVALAVVAAEDQKFPQHWGFDLRSISDAVTKGARGGRFRGASTITQQVAKNLFLWSGRSFVRKGLEAYVTVLLELLWSKRRILEVYLNIAEFGEDVYGVGAAARIIFEKNPDRLSREEAARLAAVLPGPRVMNARLPSPYVMDRARWIQEQMEQLGSAYLGNL